VKPKPKAYLKVEHWKGALLKMALVFLENMILEPSILVYLASSFLTKKKVLCDWHLANSEMST
jgi:hypothetical protein